MSGVQEVPSLTDGVKHDLVRHGHADGAAGAEALLHVVAEVVVTTREVREDGVEVAGLLDAL